MNRLDTLLKSSPRHPEQSTSSTTVTCRSGTHAPPRKQSHVLAAARKEVHAMAGTASWSSSQAAMEKEIYQPPFLEAFQKPCPKHTDSAASPERRRLYWAGDTAVERAGFTVHRQKRLLHRALRSSLRRTPGPGQGGSLLYCPGERISGVVVGVDTWDYASRS
jgi:hypothetical protein